MSNAVFWSTAFSFESSELSRCKRRKSTETAKGAVSPSDRVHLFVSASVFGQSLNQYFLGVISSACMATCCGSYCGCDASHLVSGFLRGHARGLSMVCNDRPRVGARDFSIDAFCVPLSVSVIDVCVNSCARDHDPLIATLTSFCACLTCPHLYRDDPAACLCCDRVVYRLQSDAFSSLGG
jgi:hypothetical protein